MSLATMGLLARLNLMPKTRERQVTPHLSSSFRRRLLLTCTLALAQTHLSPLLFVDDLVTALRNSIHG